MLHAMDHLCGAFIVKEYTRAAEVENHHHGEKKDYEFQAARHEWLEKLWTALGVVNALLVSSSVQPFSQPPPSPTCQVTWFGILWGITMLLNCFSLFISVVALGYLLSLPKDAPVKEFVVQLNFLVALPLISTMLGALLFVVAVIYSSRCIYSVHPFTVVASFGGLCFILSVVLGLCYRKAAAEVLEDYKNRKLPGPARPTKSTQALTPANNSTSTPNNSTQASTSANNSTATQHHVAIPVTP